MVEAYVHIIAKNSSQMLEELKKYKEVKKTMTVIGGYADGILARMEAENKKDIQKRAFEIKNLSYVRDVRVWWVTQTIM